MSEPFLTYRTAPELDQSVRQLIANLRQQNRALVTDRDRYVSMVVQARADAEALRADFLKLSRAVNALWQAYLPSITPEAAIGFPDLLYPVWNEIAVFLESRKEEMQLQEPPTKIDWVTVWGY